MHKCFPKALAVMTFCGLLLNACAEMPRPYGKPVAQQTYDHVQPLRLDVSKVMIEQRYDLDHYPSDISARLPLPPHSAIMDFARHRYQGHVSDADSFRFVLEQAAVTKRIIAQKNVLLGWTGLADEDEYRFQILVNIYRLKPWQTSGPGVGIKMDRTLVIAQRKSIAEREELQVQFVNNLVRDLDKRIELAIRQDLAL